MANKKIGGTIRNWQLHTLLTNEEQIAKAKEMYPEIQTDKVYKFTGTVVEDLLGRWNPGDHMRSSIITKIDRENGVIETYNTIYNVQDEGGDVFDDLGPGVNGIFY